MNSFFQGIAMSILSDKDNIEIEAPVTLEELQWAVAGMVSQK